MKRFLWLPTIAFAISSCSETIEPTYPSPPDSVTATLTTENAVNVSWGARPRSEKVVSYIVYRDLQEVGRTAETTFIDSTAAQSAVHAYSVSSVSADGVVSEPSAVASLSVPDKTPPRVLATSPLQGATLIDSISTIRIVFSEPIDPATATVSTVVVKDGSTALPGTVSYVTPSNAIVWTPAVPMPADKSITATITTAVKDLDGNPLKAEYTTTFHTKELVRPLVTAFFPTSGTTNVSTYQRPLMVFSEAMKTVIFQMKEIGTGEGVILGGSLDATRTVAALNPITRFKALATYDIVADTLSSTDLAGNRLTNPPHFTITYGNDFVIPRITSVTPADGATGISVNRPAIDITLDNVYVPLIGYDVSLELRTGGNLVQGGSFVLKAYQPTINYQAPVLLPNTRYTMTWSETYTDPLGNTQQNVSSWSFTTAP